MEHVFDDLIGLQRRSVDVNGRTAAAAWMLRLAGNLVAGMAIGLGIAIGMAIV